MLCPRAEPATITAMRLVACGAVLAAGCNSIFGLNDNAKLDPGDGPVLIDGELPTFKLNYLLADTAIAQGAALNSPTLASIPMDDAMNVRIGTLNGELVPAAHDAATGLVSIPIDVGTSPWKVRFTIGGVDHEVQWNPSSLDEAAVIEPILGRREVVDPPPDSGYRIVPTGTGAPGIGMFTESRVFTTGAFVDLRPGKFPTSTKFNAPNTTAVGPINSPNPMLGDAAVLVDYNVPSGACAFTSRGFAHFVPPALAKGDNVDVTPLWQTIGSVTQGFSTVNGGDQGLRLLSALDPGTRGNENGDPQFSAIEHGISAAGISHAVITERPIRITSTTTQDVSGPHMLVLMQCPLATTSTSFLVPSQLADFPVLTHALITDVRTVAGAKLVSSIVGVSAPNPVNPNMTTLDLKAPLVFAPITLTTVGASPISLSSGDGVSLPSVAMPFTLTFRFEPDQADLQTVADQLEVTVFQLTGGQLVKKRVFVTTDAAITPAPGRELATPIPIDLSGLGGGTYVMSIRSIAGTPNVGAGNFTIASPYSASTIFTNTFTIP